MNEGNSLGTQFLTRATAKFVEGDIAITGGVPGQDAILFFDLA